MREFRFGDHLGAAATAYVREWRTLLPTSALLLVLCVAAALCCYVPVLVVGGPLTVGLFACAFAALDGRRPGPVFETIGSRFLQAMIAGFLLGVLWIAVFLFFYVVLYAALFASVGLGALASNAGNGDLGPFGVVALLAVYPLMMLWMGVMMLVQVWLGARLAFVIPLIADRGTPAVDAFRTSWNATRERTLDVALLMLGAAFPAMLGIYLCYIGVIVTLPFLFLAVAAAYRDVFPPDDAMESEAAVAA